MTAWHNTSQHSCESDYMEFWGKLSNGPALHCVTQTLFWHFMQHLKFSLKYFNFLTSFFLNYLLFCKDLIVLFFKLFSFLKHDPICEVFGQKTFGGACTQLCHADLILACHAKFLLLFNMIRSMIRDSVRDPIRDPVWSDPDFVDAANLNDIHSNRSLSRSFQSHNLHPRVTGFVFAFRFTFFPFRISLFNFSNLKDTICSPKLCNKKYRSPMFVYGR